MKLKSMAAGAVLMLGTLIGSVVGAQVQAASLYMTVVHYYSDATLTEEVGALERHCNGTKGTWGTVSAYHTVEYIACY